MGMISSNYGTYRSSISTYDRHPFPVKDMCDGRIFAYQSFELHIFWGLVTLLFSRVNNAVLHPSSIPCNTKICLPKLHSIPLSVSLFSCALLPPCATIPLLPMMVIPLWLGQLILTKICMILLHSARRMPTRCFTSRKGICWELLPYCAEGW